MGVPTGSSFDPTQFLRGNGITNPNARCPVCGAAVYFYQSPDGGKVYFDELGHPWPKHPCMDQATVTSGPRCTPFLGNKIGVSRPTNIVRLGNSDVYMTFVAGRLYFIATIEDRIVSAELGAVYQITDCKFYISFYSIAHGPHKFIAYTKKELVPAHFWKP